MLAEVFPEAYDIKGSMALRHDLRRRGLRSTFPLGRYLSHPLNVKCESIDAIRRFLCHCRYVSDEEQFGKRDYWQPPELFEKTKQGDCDCFALWTWRQFLDLGFEARFVTGTAGRYRQGHAWVQFTTEGKCFLVEPAMARIGDRFPRLNTLRYHPRLSVVWDGNTVSYYSHEERRGYPSVQQILMLLPDWLIFWAFCGTRLLSRLPTLLFHRKER